MSSRRRQRVRRPLGSEPPAVKRGRSDESLLSALAAGGPLEQAAEAAGLSVRTVYRRLADPAFRARLAGARDELIVTAIGRLVGHTGRAIETLAELLESEEPRIRLGAAKTLLDQTLRLREAVLLEQRMRLLEQRLLEQQRRRKR